MNVEKSLRVGKEKRKKINYLTKNFAKISKIVISNLKKLYWKENRIYFKTSARRLKLESLVNEHSEEKKKN